MKKLISILALTSLVWACNSNPGAESESTSNTSSEVENPTSKAGQEAVEDDMSNPNILQIALHSPDHATLVAAVKACDQATALTNNGPLTVFAPTNAAFAALPAGTVETLLLPENKMKLTEIVQFHAAPGNYDIDQLKDGQSLFMASGQNAKIEKRGNETYINGAKIIGTVKASNGMVHVIDKVLLPN